MTEQPEILVAIFLTKNKKILTNCIEKAIIYVRER